MEFDHLFCKARDADLGAMLHTEKFSAESWCKVLTSGHEMIMDEESEDTNDVHPLAAEWLSPLEALGDFRVHEALGIRSEILHTPLALVPGLSGSIDDTKIEET